MDGTTARLPQQHGQDGECPARVHQVVHQQDGPGVRRRDDLKCAIEIRALVGAVLLELLLLGVADLGDHLTAGESQIRRQIPRQHGHQTWVPARRDEGHPGGLRVRSPSLPDERRRRLDQVRLERADRLREQHPVADRVVATVAEGAAGFRLQGFRDPGGEPVHRHRILWDHLPGRDHVRRHARCEPVGLVHQVGIGFVRDRQRSPAVLADAAPIRWGRVVERQQQGAHQAAGFLAAVGLDLVPLAFADADQFVAQVDIGRVPLHRGPPPQGTVADDRGGAPDREVAQRLVEAALRDVHPAHGLGRGQPIGFGQHAEDTDDIVGGRQRAGPEGFVDLRVFRARHQYAHRAVAATSGPAHLLVVGDDRARALVVNDEADIRVVVAHAERGGGDQHLQVAAGELLLQPLLGLGSVGVGLRDDISVVGVGADAATDQPGGYPFGIGLGEGVDDALAGEPGDRPGQPG